MTTTTTPPTSETPDRSLRLISVSSDDLTIGQRVQQMKTDLVSLVNRINRDGDTNTAMLGQQAVCAVADFLGNMDPYQEFDWDWEPVEDATPPRGIGDRDECD